MKNIKKIICIALLAIFAVACTDENIENSAIEKKSTQIEYLKEDSRDHTYEIDYSAEDALTIMTDFNNLMKGNNISLNEYTIEKAVFAMEFYYNYAIVDKQNEYDDSDYEERTFKFTIELNENGNIDLLSLKDKYTLFLNDILSYVNNSYLRYSDLYVLEKNDINITFALDVYPHHNFPRNLIIKSNSDQVIVSSSDVSDWIAVGNGGIDEKVRALSKKEIYGYYFFNINTTFPWLSSYYTFMKIYGFVSNPYNYNDFIFNNNRLRDLLVYPTIQKVNYYGTFGNRQSIDVWPKVFIGNKVGDNGLEAYMSLYKHQNAILMSFNTYPPLHDFVTNHLSFPDLY